MEHRNDLVTGKTLARIGLALLLLGIVFLYRWGVETDLITVEMRVGAGVALSLALLTVGWVTRANNPLFGALLQGGGVAGLFVSAFAAYSVYHLTSQTAVFTQLVFVCALSIGLAIYQRIETLAVVGVIGALAAPQMVGGTIELFPGDAGYVALVLVVVGALLFTNDWKVLYATAAATTFLTLATELISLNRGWNFTGPEALFAYGTALLALWGAPILRMALGHQQDGSVAMVATVGIPITTFFGAYLAWSDPVDSAWGIGAALLAVCMAVVYVSLRGRQPFVAALHLLPASVLSVTAIAFVFDGPTLLFAFAAHGAGFAIVGRRIRIGAIEAFGWTVYTLAALQMIAQIITLPNRGIPVFNGTALAQLGVIGLAVVLGAPLYSSERPSEPPLGRFLFGFAHVSFLVWGAVELSRTEIGQPAVSALWGGYSLIIIAVSWSRSRLARNIGLGTLLVTVGKIFLVDLENASGGAKILLLMGFGLALLALGYLMPSDRPKEETDGPGPKGTDPNDFDSEVPEPAADPFPAPGAGSPREQVRSEVGTAQATATAIGTDPWDFYSTHYKDQVSRAS